MARSIDEIQNEIVSTKNTFPELDVFDSPSSVSLWLLFTRVFAININIFEQLLDIAKEELTAISESAKAGTPDWYQNRILEFQYDATPGNAQIITEIDGSLTYPIVDESLRIIKRASVKELSNGRVFIKVATETGGILEPIGTDELTAIRSYIGKVKFAGTPIDIVSLLPDRLYISGTIYISGEFVESNIRTNLRSYINEYLSEISNAENFDGIVIRENLLNKILTAPGVKGIDGINFIMKGRAEQTPFLNSQTFGRTYEPDAGYLIEEDESGQTWDDTLILLLN